MRRIRSYGAVAAGMLVVGFILWGATELGANISSQECGYTGGPPTMLGCDLGENVTCHYPYGTTLTIAFAEAPAAYSEGQTYTITVNIADTGMTRWGFAMEAGDAAGNDIAGFTPLPDGNTEIFHCTIPFGDVIQQTEAGTFAGQADSASWSFEWTAPGSNVGDITFYLGGAACDNDGTAAGDNVGTETLVVPYGAGDTPTPTGFPSAAMPGGAPTLMLLGLLVVLVGVTVAARALRGER